MDKNLLYYLNNNECITIPSRPCNYLTIKKYLSEFKTNEEKLIALDNLGVTDKLKILKNILDNKVIEIGGIPWDVEPTEGHTEQILSSDVILKALSKYKSNETIDAIIQTLWNNVISKINSIDENIKLELLTLIPTLIDNHINEHVIDLLNLIDALDIHGIAVSNEFGNDKHIAVSLATITRAINKLWEKLEEITGEMYQGINMVVTPTFFVSENGCDVHISANTVETNGIFEKILFFVDDELIHEDTNTEYVSFDHHLDIKNEYDYVIMCKAKIMGIEYTRQQIVTRYNEFYIGAGDTYADVMDSAHARQLNGTMRHSYDVTFNKGNKLVIVMGASLRDGFIRADLNGAEIELTEEIVTIDGKQYVVLTSDTWNEGNYNIDING